MQKYPKPSCSIAYIRVNLPNDKKITPALSVFVAITA